MITGCCACDSFSLIKTDNYDNDVEQIISGLSSDEENVSFTDFVNGLFTDAVSSDSLSLHSYVEHPENYGITDYDVTLGRYNTENLDNTSEIVEALNTLKTFDRATLTKSQQITYDELMIYFENELEYCDLSLFNTDLCTTTGLQVQLPLLFAEYSFNEKKDVEEYLALLEDTDEFFESLSEYEKLRSNAGYFMEDSIASQIIEECENIVATAPDGYLISTFAERLDGLSGISESDRARYTAANAAAVNEHFVKGYNILIDTLKQLLGSNKYKGGLSNYPDGQKYFQYLLSRSLGWDKSVEDYDELLDSYTQSYIMVMQTLLSKDSTLERRFNSFSFGMTEPSTILEDLQKKIKNDFPEAVPVNYDIKYVASELQEFLSPAMYFMPQLDNLSQNSIYINPSSTSDDELYPTLAHEGYPGHLYQTTYFANTNPDLVRYIIEPNGYVEGWATYCELFSYSYADTDKSLALLAQANYAIVLCLYAKCDIGINYYSWTETDVYNYISQYGFSDKSTANSMYEAMVSNPGNYCNYVLGWIGFSELKKEAMNLSGSSFTNSDFHKYILDMGAVPFDMLFEGISDWAYSRMYQ
jgi:uncharacterized protein (DUF885 family)